MIIYFVDTIYMSFCCNSFVRYYRNGCCTKKSLLLHMFVPYFPLPYKYSTRVPFLSHVLSLSLSLFVCACICVSVRVRAYVCVYLCVRLFGCVCDCVCLCLLCVRLVCVSSPLNIDRYYVVLYKTIQHTYLHLVRVSAKINLVRRAGYALFLRVWLRRRDSCFCVVCFCLFCVVCPSFLFSF